MSDTQYTAGPWQYEKMPEGDTHRITTQDNVVIARTEYTGIEGHQKANAKLMAAAPELLEACKNALESIDELTGLILELSKENKEKVKNKDEYLNAIGLIMPLEQVIQKATT